LHNKKNYGGAGRSIGGAGSCWCPVLTLTTTLL